MESVTELVPCPVSIEVFAGGTQLYVSPTTLVTEYMVLVPGQGFTSPEIVEGVDGISLEIFLHRELEVPQALVPVTQRLPLTNDAPTESVMAFVPCPPVIVVLAGGIQL